MRRAGWHDVELTHASFFSGVGGLDLGLERAGWRTVSFSEIDPYASAVLAERWPGVPNLGDIVQLASGAPDAELLEHDAGHATLWSGGFPCQDLSVAGKRAGLAGARSGLAHAFLDLVEQHRPPAILLENVPGLLSSHGGKDFGALLGRLAELGYWWAYRILDAQYFGVPQRRRRVFICALHAGAGFGADSAAAVLSVGSRCDGHSAAGDEAGEGTAEGVERGADRTGIFNATAKFGEFVEDGTAGNLSARDYKSSNHLIRKASDPGGVRAADGLAGRLDDSVVAFTKRARVSGPDTPESWKEGGMMPTLNSFDVGDTRTTAILLGDEPQDDPLLPLGLDSHRYRCCGNGVVAPVSEWVGERLRRAVEAA